VCLADGEPLIFYRLLSLNQLRDVYMKENGVWCEADPPAMDIDLYVKIWFPQEAKILNVVSTTNHPKSDFGLSHDHFYLSHEPQCSECRMSKLYCDRYTNGNLIIRCRHKLGSAAYKAHTSLLVSGSSVFSDMISLSTDVSCFRL
jgi:hypothetical protein